MIKTPIKVLHVSYSDFGGGAARAAYRLHTALNKHNQNKMLISNMRVIKKNTALKNINDGFPQGQNFKYQKHLYLNYLSRILYKIINNPKHAFSTSWPSTGLGIELNNAYKNKQLDLINLHWLGNHCLSVKEIGKLDMPIVWRLADEWAYRGCEHYAEDIFEFEKNDLDINFITGYKKRDRFFDMDKLNFNLKKKYWGDNISIVAPSKWIAENASKSYLFNKSLIRVIPTPIDPEIWFPVDKRKARKLLNLPINKKLILFTAINAIKDSRKGFDIAIKSLKMFIDGYSIDDLNYGLVLLGENSFQKLDLNMQIFSGGIIREDAKLRLYYSACDLFLIPSRQDNLPGTGLEAQACGLPVVAFDVGGLADVIKNNVTGALVKPFSQTSFTEKIQWILNDEKKQREISQQSRLRALKLWDPKKISNMYYDFYQESIERFHSKKN